MKRLPGFRFDARTGEAHFEVIVPGTSSKGRRRKTEYAGSMDVALAKWKAFRAEVLDPSAPKARGVAPTFRAFVEKWVLPADAEPSKDEHYMLRSVLVPFFGADRLDRINVGRMRDFVTSLRERVVDGKARPYSPHTVRALEAYVRRILADAVDRDEIEHFPLKRKIATEKIPILRLELSPAEQRAFLAAFDDEAGFRRLVARKRSRGSVATSPRFGGVPRSFGGGRLPYSEATGENFERFRASRDVFEAALETGLRRGDLLGLKWSSVDLEKGFIRVTMEKTNEEAVVPISSRCREILEARVARKVVGGRVFLDEEGRHYSESTIERYFKQAKAIAGITRRFRFHDLRHTFASDLGSQGVSDLLIAKALGHTSTDMTRRYAKPSEESLRLVAEALDRKNELRRELRDGSASGVASRGGRGSA
jgi:integrase